MKLEQCNGNWNFMYEWRINAESNNWYPCHVYESERSNDKDVCIFTRNGSLMTESAENVRKMSKETYIKNREKNITQLKYCKEKGFHETLEEDLELLEKA